MRKLSEMNDGTLLYVENDDKLITAGMLREYIDYGVDVDGKYHDVKRSGKDYVVANEIEIDVVNR